MDSTHKVTSYAYDIVVSNSDPIVKDGESIVSHSELTLLVTHVLVIDNAEHTTTSEEPIALPPHELVVDSSVHEVPSEEARCVKVLTLEVDNAAHSVRSYVYEPVVDNEDPVVKDGEPVFISAELTIIVNDPILTVKNTLHSITSTNVNLLLPHVLTVNNSICSVTSTNAIALPPYALTVADSLHTVTSSNTSAVPPHDLSVNNTIHSISTHALTLSVTYNFTVNDSFLALDDTGAAVRHGVGIPYVGCWVHTITSTEPVLIEAIPIRCDDCVHEVNSTVPVPERFYVIRIPEFGCPGRDDRCNTMSITSPELILDPQVRITNLCNYIEVTEQNVNILSNINTTIEYGSENVNVLSAVTASVELTEYQRIAVSQLIIQVEVDADEFEQKLNGYIWLF